MKMFSFFSLLFLLSFNSASLYAQGFNASYANCSLPVGGSRINGEHFGYTNLYGVANHFDDNSSQTWSLTDMNNDGKPDLVVTAETNSSLTDVYAFSPGNNPYWKVFFGNGATGFSTTPTNWSLPVGGSRINGEHFGYTNIYGVANHFDDNGSQTWNLTDMNNDGKPDLVVTAEANSSLTDVYAFSPASNPYWKVYLNNGAGFNTTYISWSLPVGGSRINGEHFGYTNLYGVANHFDDNGSQTWSLTDMNNDGKVDLVVTAEANTSLTDVYAFSPANNPYWKVFFGNGATGFSTTPTNWSLPVGGSRINGEHFGYTNLYGVANHFDDNGSQTWSLTDMNNDGKVDLVVTAETNTSLTDVYAFSPANNPYWKVFFGNGSTGFNATSTNWSLPVGGSRLNGEHFGYVNMYGVANHFDDNGSQTWSVTDINGDGRIDLVVTAETNTLLTDVYAFSPANNPYWKVFFGNGATGFSTTSTNWSLPVGGSRLNGEHFGYVNMYGVANHFDDNNSQTWGVTDMNGDGRPDLVVTAETNTTLTDVYAFSPGSSPYWKVYLNNGVTGIAETKVEHNVLSVSPNPATDYVWVKTNSNTAVPLYVFNAIGQIVFENKNVVQQINVPVKNLAKGVYTVKAGNDVELFLKD